MKVKVLTVLLIGVVIGAGGLWSWNKYMVKSPAKVATQVEQSQIKELIAKVGKLVILPTNEEPEIATIKDASALIKEQIFYKGSMNGDVVLVYQKAAKAIVYSPARNIIVNVGPVVFQDPQPAETPKDTGTTTKKN